MRRGREEGRKGGGEGLRLSRRPRLKRFVLDLCDFDGITCRQRRQCPKISVTRKPGEAAANAALVTLINFRNTLKLNDFVC